MSNSKEEALVAGKTKPHELPTYVYVDASNIRNACRLSCSFQLDFLRLYEYLKSKYSSLRCVKYFEGIERGDVDKKAELDDLSKK